jgi:hypothetical protein
MLHVNREDAMSLNNYALGLLAGEKIRQFLLEAGGDRQAKAAATTRSPGRIGLATRPSAGSRTASPSMIAGRALLLFVSLLRREAARVRSAAWGE